MTHYKNLLLITVFSLSLVTITGCGSSPSNTVERFYTAVENGDTKTLEEVASQELVGLFAMFGAKAKKGMEERGKPKSYSHSIKGDTAVVTVTFNDGKNEKVDLKKVKGKWQIQMPPM